ncbi:MAG: type II secretion system protein GspN [Nitrospirae bacterium]|nr:type II secretion system protein GspN [Nitrospirota bacterium]
MKILNNTGLFIKRNIRGIVLYTLFCLASFLLFFIILFPRDTIRKRIIYEIEKATATDIRSSGYNWRFPAGLRFTGMELRKRGAATAYPIVRIDNLGVEIPLGSIASMSPVSNVSASLYGGTVRGTITMRSSNRLLKADWSNIDMSRVDILKTVPVTLEGKANGDLVLRLAGNRPEGQIRILIRDGKFGKLRVMGFAIPEIPLDEINGTVNIKENTISLKEIRFKNSDIKGSITGSVKLASGSEQGSLDLAIRFSVGEKMKAQYQGILSFISSTRDREGYYTLHIKGDPAKPTVGI